MTELNVSSSGRKRIVLAVLIFFTTLMIPSNVFVAPATAETNTPPVAIFSVSTNMASTGTVIHFDASSSYDPDGSIINYHWDFGDGWGGFGVEHYKLYADDGAYTVTLTVTDNDGASDSSTATIWVLNRPPVPVLHVYVAGNTGLCVASDSYDPDGYIVSYFWNFGDGTTAETTESTITHYYGEAGTYTVRLTVTDDDGAIGGGGYPNSPPVADPNGPYWGVEGVPVTFFGSGSYDPDGAISWYQWLFGDGTPWTVGVNPTHTYAQVGTYTVTLQVRDYEDAWHEAQTTVTIVEPLSADFYASPTSGYEPLYVQFNDLSSSYDGIVTWEWRVYRGSTLVTTLSGKNPNMFLEEGSYTVTLTVWEADGDSDYIEKANYITVTGSPPTTVISLSGAVGWSGWYTSDVTVTLTATDTGSGVANTYYSLDGGATWATYTSSFTITTEGTNTVQYYSTDNIGNQEDTKTETIKIDKTPPTTSISLSGTLGSNDWYTSDVTVTLIPTDNLSLLPTYSFTITTEGTHPILYYSIDNAGNQEDTKTETIKIDKTPPTTTISLSGIVGNNGWYTSDVTVTLTPTDDPSGVANTYYLTPEQLETFWSMGDVNRDGCISIMDGMLIERALGTSPATGGVPGEWGAWNPDADLDKNNLVDNSDLTIYESNYGLDIEWTTYTSPFTITTEGIHKIQYYSVDNAGNQETAKSETIKIDKTMPNIIIYEPLTGDYYNFEFITLDFTTTDAVSGIDTTTATLDITAVFNGQTIDLSTLSLGTHTLTVTATDIAGLQATQQVTFNIIPPPAEMDATKQLNRDTVNNKGRGRLVSKTTVFNTGFPIIKIEDTEQFPDSFTLQNLAVTIFDPANPAYKYKIPPTAYILQYITGDTTATVTVTFPLTATLTYQNPDGTWTTLPVTLDNLPTNWVIQFQYILAPPSTLTAGTYTTTATVTAWTTPTTFTIEIVTATLTIEEKKTP